MGIDRASLAYVPHPQVFTRYIKRFADFLSVTSLKRGVWMTGITLPGVITPKSTSP